MSKGRPSVYTPELGELICERLADGETLTSICKDDLMPSGKTVRTWAADNSHPFSPQYIKARFVGYMKMADDILDIADENSNDTYTTDDGKEKVNTEVVKRSQLRVDTRKWLLSKALPKIYGDKPHEDKPPSMNIENLTLDEQEQLQILLKKAQANAASTD